MNIGHQGGIGCSTWQKEPVQNLHIHAHVIISRIPIYAHRWRCATCKIHEFYWIRQAGSADGLESLCLGRANGRGQP